MPTDAPATTGPDVAIDAVTFRVADPDPQRPLRAVRLRQEVRVPDERLHFRRDGTGAWSLTLARPAVDRMEYLLELTHADGGTETVCDPANPRRAPGPFGEKSVVEFPGYTAPAWLAAAPPRGAVDPLALPARSIRGQVHGRLWAPAGVPAEEPLPLLVAHDGPEYDDLAHLTAYLAALVHDDRLPPLRAALLSPGPRDDWYSANGAYTRALCLAVVPQLRQLVATSTVVGMGASLGALAMLHAQRRHAGTFDALFLQSGSFFHPRHDAHESGFPHYRRVVGSVDAVLRARGHRDPVPAVLTCGGIEENLENNRLMARALSAQGYDVALHELRDVHSYTAWRDAFDPHLTALLRSLA